MGDEGWEWVGEGIVGDFRDRDLTITLFGHDMAWLRMAWHGMEPFSCLTFCGFLSEHRGLRRANRSEPKNNA